MSGIFGLVRGRLGQWYSLRSLEKTPFHSSTMPSWGRVSAIASDTSAEAMLAAFASMPMQEVLAHLQSAADGLTDLDAGNRLTITGENILPSQKAPSKLMLLLRVIPNPFNILLLVLAIINVSIPPPDWAAFTVLMIMVLISCAVRFWQEHRSSIAIFRLQSSITSEVTVIRKEQKTIFASQLVPGDITALSSGDLVPADCLVIQSSFMRVGQSQWTGEGKSVSKSPSINGEKGRGSVFDMNNIIFMGTGVVSGSCLAMVLQTGRSTLMAAMSKKLTSDRRPNAFERGIRYVTWMLIGFMTVMVPIVLVVSGRTTGDWSNAALFSISVAVGLVPEMLPAIVNANLARGAWLISKKRAIVRRLDSVQNLGAMSVLCSDKTGTLTRDEISLTDWFNCIGVRDIDVLKLATIESTSQGRAGNAMDAAILAFRFSNGAAVEIPEYSRSTTVPFDFERRRSTCVVHGVAGGAMVICKGAFEEVMARCSHLKIAEKLTPFDKAYRKKLSDHVMQLNLQGYRVLLVATKQAHSSAIDNENEIDDLETGMTAHGLSTFVDPPKPDAAASIAKLDQLGIEVKVLTGDNLAVAVNICQALNIVRHAAMTSSEDGLAVTGAQLSLMPSTNEFNQAVARCRVFAKVTPNQKMAIVASLKSQGHCVGMLGDGMNDCLALRESDVGISVDSAASAAKDCADFILTEKGLQIITESVAIGRATHANTIKYIKMVLSSNFGNVFSILAASSWLRYTPMSNLQILAQNLLYDISQIAIPWDNVDNEYLERPRAWKPWVQKDLLRFVVILGPTSSVIDICTFLLNWFYYNIRGTGNEYDVQIAQTHWFLQGLLTQTVIVHMLRTRKIPFIQSRSSRALAISTAMIMSIGLAIPWIPAFQKALSFARPATSYVGFLAAELLAYCLEVQLVKMVYVQIWNYWL